MKVLTAAQMREIDRVTMERGIPGPILMENAGHRVVELLAEKFSPLSQHRIVVLCGKGNNGGDGLVVARQLHTRFRPRALHVVLVSDPPDNLPTLLASGCLPAREITPEMRQATLVIDALLGTGIKGPATGRMLEAIREINSGFPGAKVVAVDIPSGMPSDSGHPVGECVRADYTVTFTGPKVGLVMPPNCDLAGELLVVPIGTPPEFYEDDDSLFLSLVEPKQFVKLLGARSRGAHKGDFGHVLVVGGAPGKVGAAAMAGLAALRAGAGLVTVACSEAMLAAIAPELMTEPWPGNPQRKDVVALGPGLGAEPANVEIARHAAATFDQPMVIDADGLNALAGTAWSARGKFRVLTPHPGEMSRLAGKTTREVQEDRIGVARSFAMERGARLVLKGQRSLIALPDGRVWINPTGSPAMAKGGSGDILTGLIAGLMGQFPGDLDLAVAAAVYLHGLAGELGAARLGEKSLLATDLLTYLPAAIDACKNV